MDAFLGWFFEFMSEMINGLALIFEGIFKGLLQIFNLVEYSEIFRKHYQNFTPVDWILAILAIVLIVAIWLILVWVIFLYIRRAIRMHKMIISQENIFEEIADLHKELLRVNDEKDRILAMKVSQAGVSAKALAEELADITQKSYASVAPRDVDLADENVRPSEQGNAEYGQSGQSSNSAITLSRFSRLIEVDERYTYYTPDNYVSGFTLEELCNTIRNFACSRMHLFYDVKIIRCLIAGMSSTKMILLQGISGTGKTSLPYCLGKFFTHDATIASVQPSWRDRTELFGYFNEFTKKFNETEVLRRIYESSYNENINLIILDEMNIARVEYYFAEMLSILEMPNHDEWKLELVSSSWPTDPKNLKNGNLSIPENLWYVGTANNDDSTFSVSDKVYDRALTINLDTKGQPFDAPDTEPMSVSFTYLNSLFEKAWHDYPITKENIDKINRLDIYIIQKLRIAFGNRIIKQLHQFVPAYVACGGTEIDGIDYVLATKVFRKFESLNLSLIRDELKELDLYLSKSFGKNNMQECRTYLERLQKMY